MFFFLFGYGTRFKERGPGEDRTCHRCAKTSTWLRLHRFTEVTFFFVPILRFNRSELEACPVCGEAHELPKPEKRSPWGLPQVGGMSGRSV